MRWVPTINRFRCKLQYIHQYAIHFTFIKRKLQKMGERKKKDTEREMGLLLYNDLNRNNIYTHACAGGKRLRGEWENEAFKKFALCIDSRISIVSRCFIWWSPYKLKLLQNWSEYIRTCQNYMWIFFYSSLFCSITSKFSWKYEREREIIKRERMLK